MLVDTAKTILQDELTRFRGLLGPVFENWWLIPPSTMTHSAGVYQLRVKKLTGSRPTFKEETVETTTKIDTGELYFLDTVTNAPLLSLPFFRMMPSPETEETACYFYSRLEKEGWKWISYNFEGKPDLVEPDASLDKIVDEIEGEQA